MYLESAVRAAAVRVGGVIPSSGGPVAAGLVVGRSIRFGGELREFMFTAY